MLKAPEPQPRLLKHPPGLQLEQAGTHEGAGPSRAIRDVRTDEANG